MPVRVVDASALAALLFGEPEADAVAATLGDAHLVAPALLGFELASICLKKMRRHPEQTPALFAALALRHRLGIETMTVNHDRALVLAARTGLTAYDASYLWLAHEVGAQLVTLDRRLARAAVS